MAIPQLKTIFLDCSASMLNPAIVWCLEEMEILVAFLNTWKVPANQIAVHPMMRPEADYFSGIFFQIHLVQPPRSPLLVGIGGR